MADADTSLDAAITAYDKGDLDAARAIGEVLVAENPQDGDAHNVLSAIAQDQGRLTDAEFSARAALATDSRNAVYLNTLANALRRQGRTDEAIDAFEQARQSIPDQPDILFNLGNALRDAGRYGEAVDAFRASLAVRPGVVAAYNNLAITLKAMGDPEGAATVIIEGLAFEPKSPHLRFNLGNALQASGRFDAAEAAYRRAVELDPGHADAWVNLGVVLAEQNEKPEAEASFKTAIGLNPDLAQAYVGLADLADDGSLDAVAHRRTVLSMRPDLAAIHSSLLMCLHYTAEATVDDLYNEHLVFGARHKAPEAPAYSDSHSFDPDRPLRLGVVSGDFRFHAMAFFALPVFAARNPEAWALICYSTTDRPDSHTTQFHHMADRWRDIRALSDRDLVDLVVADEIDILIDLSGHAPRNRLRAFAAKPAPLQVAWGDYVDTRGLDTIDVLIGDATHTPASEEHRYIEKVLRMPNDYICYKPPTYLPSIAPAPAAANGYLTFGTFSELTKIQLETVALWSKVLRALPESRFFANGYLLADEARQGRLLSMFVANGIGTDRVIIGTGGDHADFLSQYSTVDVILDTWPYSGGLTTCESLVMGVPVVTLTGDRFSGRHATAHLKAAGFGQWAAGDESTFIQTVQALAADSLRLSALRRQVRKQILASPLCDGAQFADHFYGLLRDAWSATCARHRS